MKGMRRLLSHLVSEQMRVVLMALLESTGNKYRPIQVINDTSKQKDLLSATFKHS